MGKLSRLLGIIDSLPKFERRSAREFRKRIQEERGITKYDIVVTSYSMLQKDYIHYTDNNIEFDLYRKPQRGHVSSTETHFFRRRLGELTILMLQTGFGVSSSFAEEFGKKHDDKLLF